MKLRTFIYFAVILVFAGKIFAADVPAEFNVANKLYAEGKFAEAANTYQTILKSGVVSPNLLFNEGNAEFKSGNLGKAIADYRRASLLTPRDENVRANLDFARNQVQGTTLRESHWEDWLGDLTLNEWTTLATIAFWLTLALFAAMQIRPSLKTALRGLARGVAIITILLFVCLGADAAIHFSKSIAVIVSPDVIARSGPFDDAQKAFTVNDGAELAVLDKRNGWLQVTDGSGRIGWLQNEQGEVMPAI
jgi:tetratricopeptide (TPR) repeat protein